MTTIRTFALALAMLMATQPTAASWANVRNIPPGTRVNVRTLDGGSQSGYSITKGRFESADEHTLVLRTNRKRQTLMLPKSAVEEIRVRIPFTRRKMPWIVTGAAGVVTLIILPYVPFRGGTWGDDTPHIFARFGLICTGGIAALTFGRGNMKTIYPVTRFDVRKIQPAQPSGKLTSPPARKVPIG